MKTLTIFSLVIAVVAISIASFLYVSRPRVAFVYNMKILQEYNGTKEGQKLYQDKVQALRSNLDTLGSEINKAISQYEKDKKTMSEKELQLTEELLKKKQNDYYSYKDAIEKRIKEEDNKLTQAVLKQIDTFVMDYAKKMGYDFILGSTNEGSLFFAADKYDITEEVLKGLNKTYAGNVNK